MITGLTLFAILALVGYLVLLPLVSNKPEQPALRLEELIDETEETIQTKDKEALYSIINEIEFDYKMNKLSQDDYEQLKTRYRQQALEILYQEDDLELETEILSTGTKRSSETDIRKEIDHELQTLRQNNTSSKQ